MRRIFTKMKIKQRRKVSSKKTKTNAKQVSLIHAWLTKSSHKSIDYTGLTMACASYLVKLVDDDAVTLLIL